MQLVAPTDRSLLHRSLTAVRWADGWELRTDVGVPSGVQGTFRLFTPVLILAAVSCREQAASGSRHELPLLGSANAARGDKQPLPFVLQPGKSVVLPEQLANLARAQCSRADFPDFDRTWTPSADDVAHMEAQLFQLNRYFHSRSSSNSKHALDVNDYHRQYLGLLLGRHLVIYINALYNRDVDSTWKTQVFNICDGGFAAWGCLYDPVDGSFDAFRINGFG